jgi:hypothetical protein
VRDGRSFVTASACRNHLALHSVVRRRNALKHFQATQRHRAAHRLVRHHAADRAPQHLRRRAQVERTTRRVRVATLAHQAQKANYSIIDHQCERVLRKKKKMQRKKRQVKNKKGPIGKMKQALRELNPYINCWHWRINQRISTIDFANRPQRQVRRGAVDEKKKKKKKIRVAKERKQPKATNHVAK